MDCPYDPTIQKTPLIDVRDGSNSVRVRSHHSSKRLAEDRRKIHIFLKELKLVQDELIALKEDLASRDVQTHPLISSKSLFKELDGVEESPIREIQGLPIWDYSSDDANDDLEVPPAAIGLPVSISDIVIPFTSDQLNVLSQQQEELVDVQLTGHPPPTAPISPDIFWHDGLPYLRPSQQVDISIAMLQPAVVFLPYLRPMLKLLVPLELAYSFMIEGLILFLWAQRPPPRPPDDDLNSQERVFRSKGELMQ